MKPLIWTLGSVLVACVVASTVVFFGLGYYLSPQDQLTKTDAIVAISGGETDTRAAEAIKLYQEGWSNRLIFSGAAQDTTGPSNAAAMRQQALAAGVPESAIQLDEKSANTQENADNVQQLVSGLGYRSIILVTSPYHQRRAYMVFHRALPGITVINHSCIDHSWSRSQWWATLASRALTVTELQKVLYELLGDRSA